MTEESAALVPCHRLHGLWRGVGAAVPAIEELALY